MYNRQSTDIEISSVSQIVIVLPIKCIATKMNRSYYEDIQQLPKTTDL